MVQGQTGKLHFCLHLPRPLLCLLQHAKGRGRQREAGRPTRKSDASRPLEQMQQKASVGLSPTDRESFARGPRWGGWRGSGAGARVGLGEGVSAEGRV